MAYIGTEPKDVRSFGRAKFDYTATQGQTAFTGADDDGKTLGFTDGQMEVFVNGILMDESDFSTSNSNTVTLASAANLNDIISIVAMQTDIPNSDYVPASGGTFTGNVTHSGTVTNNGNVGINTTPTAKLHINTGTSYNDFDQVLIEGSRDDGSSNPEITLKRSTTSPADGDYNGSINFYGNNSADEDIKYAQIVMRTEDVTDSSEDGALVFNTYGGAANRETLYLSNNDTRVRTNNIRIASHLTSGENSAGPTIGLLRNDSTTASGDVLGTFGFGHTDGDPDFPGQTPQQLPVSIRGVAAETASDGDDGANMEFYTKPINANKDVNSTLNMKIDNAGRVTMPNQIGFSYCGSKSYVIAATGTQVMTSSNVWSASINHSHNRGSHFDVSTGRFTCPIGGRYLFMFNCQMSNFGSGYLYSYMRLNQSVFSYSQKSQENAWTAHVHTAIMELNANDYVDMAWTNNYVSGQIHYPEFTGQLIG